MARRRHRNTTNEKRDHFSIANTYRGDPSEPRIRVLPSLNINSLPEVRSTLQSVEDLREWHPDAILEAPTRSLRRSRVTLHSPAPKSTFSPRRQKLASFFHSPEIRAFSSPKFVAVCIRRKIRKEVMHALGKSGLGAKKTRRYRRNANSTIRC